MVEEFFVPKQVCDGTNTDMTPDAVMDLMLQLQAKGIASDRIMFWWHSHVDMPTKPSLKDEETIERLSPKNGLWSIITNKADAKRVLMGWRPTELYIRYDSFDQIDAKRLDSPQRWTTEDCSFGVLQVNILTDAWVKAALGNVQSIDPRAIYRQAFRFDARAVRTEKQETPKDIEDAVVTNGLASLLGRLPASADGALYDVRRTDLARHALFSSLSKNPQQCNLVDRLVCISARLYATSNDIELDAMRQLWTVLLDNEDYIATLDVHNVFPNSELSALLTAALLDDALVWDGMEVHVLDALTGMFHEVKDASKAKSAAAE